jgi:hypothetical protein
MSPEPGPAATPAVAPDAAPETATPAENRQRVVIGIVAGVIGLLIIVAVIWSVIYLANNPQAASNVRDIFIIFLALMSMLVVVALVILIALLARLVLMLQNEVTPLLTTIDETLRTIRGTTVFMSENVVSPVVKASSYAAGARRFFEVLAGLKPRR